MVEATPRALSVSGAMCMLAVVLAAVALAPAQGVDAQTAARTVGLAPSYASYDVGMGQFGVFVVLRGDEHDEAIGYDDDRDGVDDRFVQSVGLGAFEFALRFDHTKLQFVSVTELVNSTHNPRSFQCMQRNDEPGAVKFACVSVGTEAGPQPVAGELSLAMVTLLPIAPGSSGLELEGQLSGPLGDPIDAEITSGSIRLTGDPVETEPPGDPVESGPTPGDGATPAQSAVSGEPGDQNGPSASNDPQGQDGPGGQELTSAGEATPGSGDGASSQGDESSGAPDSGVRGSVGGEDGSPEGLDSEGSAGVQGAGGSRWTAVIWTLAVLAGLAGAVAVGFAAVRWQGSK